MGFKISKITKPNENFSYKNGCRALLPSKPRKINTNNQINVWPQIKSRSFSMKCWTEHWIEAENILYENLNRLTNKFKNILTLSILLFF